MVLQEVVTLLQQAAQTYPGLVAVYLYGSYATNTARAHSDIDVAVLFDANTPDLLEAEMRLEQTLSHEPALARVEVIALNRAKLKLKAEVLQHALRIYCRDIEARVSFGYETMREWWDVGPWLEIYDREYFARLKEAFTDDQREAYQRARQTFTRAA